MTGPPIKNLNQTSFSKFNNSRSRIKNGDSSLIETKKSLKEMLGLSQTKQEFSSFCNSGKEETS